MIQELFSFLAVVFSAAIGAYLYAFMTQIRALRLDMQAQLKEFAAITKAASDANNSIADKLIAMDQRLDSIDSWRSMVATSQHNSGWKK